MLRVKASFTDDTAQSVSAASDATGTVQVLVINPIMHFQQVDNTSHQTSSDPGTPY